MSKPKMPSVREQALQTKCKRLGEINDDVANTTLSLTKAINDAGGSIHEFLLDMSLRDFIIEMAAPNGIRFRFVKDLQERERNLVEEEEEEELKPTRRG